MASLANTLLGPLVDRDGVVSSPDLVPLIIKHVECNGRVPRVCSTWHKGWDQHHRGKGSMKNASCEKLPAAALEQDDFFGSAGGFVSDVASVGEGLIISRGPDGQALQLVDQNMAVKSEKKMEASSLLHATDQSVLTAEPGTGAVTGSHSTALRLRSLPGFDLIREVPLEAQVDGGLSHCDTLRAGTVVDGRLICTVGTPVFDGPPGEFFFLRVYDAGSLAFQRAIPLDFAPAFGALAVKGDEAFIGCDGNENGFAVLSLASGEVVRRRQHIGHPGEPALRRLLSRGQKLLALSSDRLHVLSAAAPYPLVQTLRLVGPEGAAGVVATSASLSGDRLLVGLSAGYQFPGVVVGCPTLLAFEDY